MHTAEASEAVKKFAMPSGATLHMGRPQFADAGRLRNALARAAGARPFTPDEMKLGLAELKQDPSAGGALVQRLLAAMSSEEVEAAVFSCLKNSTYQPKDTEARIKVTPDLFDHAVFGDGARVDFYPICFRAAEVAIGPFLGTLVSMYTEFQATRARVPASQ